MFGIDLTTLLLFAVGGWQLVVCDVDGGIHRVDECSEAVNTMGSRPQVVFLDVVLDNRGEAAIGVRNPGFRIVRFQDGVTAPGNTEAQHTVTTSVLEDLVDVEFALLCGFCFELLWRESAWVEHVDAIHVNTMSFLGDDVSNHVDDLVLATEDLEWALPFQRDLVRPGVVNEDVGANGEVRLAFCLAFLGREGLAEHGILEGAGLVSNLQHGGDQGHGEVDRVERCCGVGFDVGGRVDGTGERDAWGEAMNDSEGGRA